MSVNFSKMWTRILDTPYFLCFANKVEIYVTDFITIWSCVLSEERFLKSLKDSNFALDLKNADFISKGIALLSKCSKLRKGTVMPEAEGKKLNLHLTMSCGYLFHLKLTLYEGSKELFFYKVTQNLLKSVDNLRKSERELRKYLLKKDKEIEEYKCEGGEIALRHLKTIPFDEATHMASHRVYEDYFGSSDIPDHLLLKTKTSDFNEDGLADIKPVLKEEPPSQTINGIKMEIYSQSSINDETTSIKTEPNSSTNSNSESMNSGSDMNLMSVNQIKVESVKIESDTNLIKVSPRKKFKTKLNI